MCIYNIKILLSLYSIAINISVMPITIKQNTIGFRDENGEFHYANTLAENSANDYINQIKTTGQETINTINTNKDAMLISIRSASISTLNSTKEQCQKVLASIPEDYTSVNEDVQELKKLSNILYNNNNLLPASINGWKIDNDNVYEEVIVNDIYKGIYFGVGQIPAYLSARIPVTGISNLGYFSMSVLEGSTPSLGTITINGHETSGNISNIYSDKMLIRKANAVIDISLDLNINVEAFDYIEFIINPDTKNTDFTFYKMFLGSKKEKYSILLDIIENSKK